LEPIIRLSTLTLELQNAQSPSKIRIGLSMLNPSFFLAWEFLISKSELQSPILRINAMNEALLRNKNFQAAGSLNQATRSIFVESDLEEKGKALF
jgi:hypothetical protein